MSPRDSLRVWALIGSKAGDNSQVASFVRLMGWSAETKALQYNWLRLLPNWLLRSTFRSLAAGSREQLREPWPDVVVAVGQRSVPVATAIRKRSGGRTRLIQLGRPRAPLWWFDLVITTPQYQLPACENVLHIDLPIVAPDPEETARSLEAWHREQDDDGRDLIALLIGGEVAPFCYDEAAIERLARDALKLVESRDARLVVSCGRRMPAAAAESLARLLGADCCAFHVFSGSGEANPYPAFLDLATEFIVATDSASMMADAVSTGRPVHLFTPTIRASLPLRALSALAGIGGAIMPETLLNRLVAAGLVVPLRRTLLVATRLVAAGRAVHLGDSDKAAPAGSGASDRDSIIRRGLLAAAAGEGSDRSR